MNNKSMAKNAALNTIKTIMAMVFPLITFPYASRVLQVDNIGKVNYSASIISYFSLLAGLGIKTYAVREGARIREDKQALEKFTNQMFTVNVISTVISYFLLAVLVYFSPNLSSYKTLIAIQSINIIGTTIGIEWLYTIVEDYYYITMRSIFVQFVSMLLLFALVHSKEDYIIYAGISVFATTASYIFNFVHAKKIVRVRLTKHIDVAKHLKPIMIIFAMSIATTIYVNSDTTMLGILGGDYYVGVYSTSTKMYSILKNVMSASILVALPRLSHCLATENKERFQFEAGKILNSFIVLLLPTVVGTFMLSKDIILILAGDSFLEASTSLQILCVSLVFSIFAIYMTNVILLPAQKEKDIMYATIVSAVVNVILNFVFIPWLKHNGAAITTTISEAVVLVWQIIAAKEYIRIKIKKAEIGKVVIGCGSIIIVCVALECVKINLIMDAALKVVVSVLVYAAVLVLTRHQVAVAFITGVKRKFGIADK